MENISRHGNATNRRCSCSEGIAATSVFVAACVHQNTAMAQRTQPRKHLTEHMSKMPSEMEAAEHKKQATEPQTTLSRQCSHLAGMMMHSAAYTTSGIRQ
jgi:hypothetical protein